MDRTLPPRGSAQEPVRNPLVARAWRVMVRARPPREGATKHEPMARATGRARDHTATRGRHPTWATYMRHVNECERVAPTEMQSLQGGAPDRSRGHL
eukprot:scaffold1589_cov111-Isochrysis_galbana.AAC.16